MNNINKYNITISKFADTLFTIFCFMLQRI